MKKAFGVILTMIVLSLHAVFAHSSVVAKVNLILTVVDDKGAPVGDAKVSGSGWIPGKYGAAVFNDVTDKNGEYKVSFNSAVDYGFHVVKDGYYRSYMFYYLSDGTGPKIADGYWQPNPMKKTVVLKPIKNPVPMYVKGVKEKAPVYGQPVGYDLMAGDWVAPYGKGSVQDFIFNVTGEKNESGFNANTKMVISFSNEKDGIQFFKSSPLHNEEPLGSKFWSAYEAPLDGYEPVYEYERIIAKGVTRKDLNFYYRVRTQVDENGQVEKAMYGKIYKDFYCYYDHFNNEIKVCFWYYLNPDWTRNVEFSSGQNLFPEGNNGYLSNP